MAFSLIVTFTGIDLAAASFDLSTLILIKPVY